MNELIYNRKAVSNLNRLITRNNTVPQLISIAAIQPDFDSEKGHLITNNGVSCN